jgi:hydrogenase-4 component B
MGDSLLLILLVFLPISGIIAVLFLPHHYRAKFSFLFVILLAASISIPAFEGLGGKIFDVTVKDLPVFGNITFHIDGLSSWFILIINLTCINGAWYGIGYMKQYHHQRANLALHWIAFLLFQSSMLWVCIVQNSLVFLIVWELMSISSFLLVIFDHENKTTLQAGINYLVQMHIGILFLTIAFIWVYFSEGSLEFSAIETFFNSNSNLWLFTLFFTGFGIKAGFIPLHSWLPQAHPAAPSHISGVMSGVIVKIGIYGIFRMIFLLKKDYTIMGECIISLSLLTGLYGILNAAIHRDYKKMLAYCTIENIGIIGMGIGLGLIGVGNGNPTLTILGFTAALLHTLNHSLFKSLLFFTAGSVYQQTHTRDMEKLGGLMRKMPQTALIFLIGGIAIGGLPPFNGFVSEFILFNGILVGIKSLGNSYNILMIFSLAGLALIGGLSMLTFTKSFGTIFLGNPRTPFHEPPGEVDLSMRLPQYLIIILMLSIGLFPQLYFPIVNNIILKIFPISLPVKSLFTYSFTNSISSVGKYAALLIVLSIIIYMIRYSLTRRRPAAENSTWGCGYPAPNTRMQYTGKSFSKSLGKLLNFVVLENKKYKEISTREIFPAGRKYSSHYNDLFVTKIFDGIISRLLYSLNYFQFIQNGKIQMYILYGVFFILLIFLGTIFKFI